MRPERAYEIHVRDEHIAVLKAERDRALSALAAMGREIADFQDCVRDALIEGLNDVGIQKEIDGAGSDGGWQEFTLSEIRQAFGAIEDKVSDLQTGSSSAHSPECLRIEFERYARTAGIGVRREGDGYWLPSTNDLFAAYVAGANIKANQ